MASTATRGSNGTGRRRDYLALATDGDGTLLREKRLSRATLSALRRLRESGRRLVLATGENPEQLECFPHCDVFDLIVAENGALLGRPGDGYRRLAEPPPPELVRELRRRGVKPLTAGEVIVSSRRPREGVIGRVLRDLGLDWRLVYNREEVMALPAGVDKGKGLRAAVAELGLSPGRVVAVGDAENDVALIDAAGCGVAVADAVPLLRERATVVTRGGPGRGVVELIERLLALDLPTPAVTDKPERGRGRKRDRTRAGPGEVRP